MTPPSDEHSLDATLTTASTISEFWVLIRITSIVLPNKRLHRPCSTRLFLNLSNQCYLWSVDLTKRQKVCHYYHCLIRLHCFLTAWKFKKCSPLPWPCSRQQLPYLFLQTVLLVSYLSQGALGHFSDLSHMLIVWTFQNISHYMQDCYFYYLVIDMIHVHCCIWPESCVVFILCINDNSPLMVLSLTYQW